jgi:hypothetical protein
MSVVIDEFDVVANEGQSRPPSPPPMPANTAGSAPTVHDVELAIERQRERDVRVWAH